MTMKARTSGEVAAMVEAHLARQTIERFQVFGVNSLKTMEPAPGALVGESIRSVETTSDTTFTLLTDGLAVDVDLQRTGELRWSAELAPWDFGQPSMPTGQLLLRGGGGVNFSEPGKTKRITFRLRSL